LSVRELIIDVLLTSGTVITAKTIRNILHDAKIRERAPREKTFISKKNMLNKI
jgi:hypothetical protein